MFDLAGLIRMRLENAGVLMIDDVGVDTYSDERFYSYPALGAPKGAGLTAATFMRSFWRHSARRTVFNLEGELSSSPFPILKSSLLAAAALGP